MEIQRNQGEMSSQLLNIQTRLQTIEDKQNLMDSGVQQRPDNKAGPRTVPAPNAASDTTRDRRRLKERLKRAARNTPSVEKRAGWIEIIFGICSGDLRTGTEGSRCAPGPPQLWPHICLKADVCLRFVRRPCLQTRFVDAAAMQIQ